MEILQRPRAQRPHVAENSGALFWGPVHLGTCEWTRVYIPEGCTPGKKRLRIYREHG
jgi:hypothetical protein